MMRRFTLLLMVLLLLLAGCVQQEPAETQTPTTPVEETQSPAETEPPATLPKLEAGAVYRKMALNMGSKWVTGYTKSAEIIVESAEASYRTDATSTMRMSTSPLSVCLETETMADIDAPGMKMSITDESEVYVRMENSVPVTYFHGVTYDEWYRYETGETAGDIMAAYSYFNFVYSTAPEALTMDDATQIVDGREVYVLRFTMPGEEAMGEYAKGVELEYVYYVDAETFMLLQQETVYYGMDQYIMDTIRGMVGEEAIGDENLFTRMEMRETMTNISFDPMEVQEVPQEGIDNSLDITDIPYEEEGGAHL